MIASQYMVRKLGRLLKTGEAWIEGRTCDGTAWPDGNHYWIVIDSTTQTTYHVLCADRQRWKKYSPMHR